MMPMGFEYGWSRRLDVVSTRDDQPEPKRFDLSEFIAEVNAMKKSIPAFNEEGPAAPAEQPRRSAGGVGAAHRARRRARLHSRQHRMSMSRATSRSQRCRVGAEH